MKTPSVLYPTLVWGFVSGEIRCESIDGSELWLPHISGNLLIRPFKHSDGKTYCVSHLQKRSKFFSLRFDPFIFHWGKFWHLQEQDEQGNWKPGTERGIYMRSPGYRWQIPDDNSHWTPWIWSWGYGPGMHLD